MDPVSSVWVYLVMYRNYQPNFIPVNFLSTYRKIFTVVFTANLITFVAFMVKNRGAPLQNNVASASSANLMLFSLDKRISSIFATKLPVQLHTLSPFSFGVAWPTFSIMK